MALKALDKSLALAPHNAQALALKGYILAAQNQPTKARDWFNRAIAADAALGNAWLGRGLTRIHLGDKSGGREDLLAAAALEPQRAELRSYLGKAYAHTGDDVRARKELALAKKLDPNDPTAWLYSALLNQQDNQINDAIRDLEKSQSLNDNRSVYRSQLLLDQDSAVRSANLAWMYQDDGMFDLSMREAGRAVSTDYANYSAHVFLANSYDQLRDPDWTNLRYETPAVSEYWMANLLAPTSAGWLSTITSEQPYAKLFDQNRVGIISDTTYLDRGAWTEYGAVFGTSDRLSFSLETTDIIDPGQRPNDNLDNRQVSFSLKYQLTPKDSVFVQVNHAEIKSGDLNEYYSENGQIVARALYGNPGSESDMRAFITNGVRVFIRCFWLQPAPLETRLPIPMQAIGSRLFLNMHTVNSVRLLSDHDLRRQNFPQGVFGGTSTNLGDATANTPVVGARYFWGDLILRIFKTSEWITDTERHRQHNIG